MGTEEAGGGGGGGGEGEEVIPAPSIGSINMSSISDQRSHKVAMVTQHSQVEGSGPILHNAKTSQSLLKVTPTKLPFMLQMYYSVPTLPYPPCVSSPN